MRIAHVVRQFHPAVGGLETVVLELVKSQIARGHTVRVVTLNRLFNDPDHAELPARRAVAGAEVISIPFIGSTRYPIAPSVTRHVMDVDVVHVHGIDFFFDYLAWTKPFHKRPLVASTHGGFFHTPRNMWLKKLFFATVTRASLTWYGGIAAVSRSDYNQFRGRRGHGMTCIENGVDISKYANAASERPTKSIVSIGRLATNKRLDRLIAFMQALHRRDFEWRLKILGRPWDVDQDALRTMVDHFGLRDVVEIKVLPTDVEIRAAMRECSIAASASEYEGFGIVAVEALSAGLLPLLNDIPPFREVVDRTGIGLVVDFSQPEEAADELLGRWQAIEANYADLRSKALGAAHQFEWSQGASDAYEALYESVVGSKVRTILDVSVQVDTPPGAIRRLDSLYRAKRPSVVAFANAHMLNIAAADLRFRQLLGRCVVFNDGIGADIASRILYGTRFPSNLNGSDFVPRYLQETENQFRIFLLGSKPGVAERAARRLNEICPQHRIVGCYSGYFRTEDKGRIAGLVREAGADVIMVGMGNPLQEVWLDQHIAATGCRLGIAVGALFDFLSDEVPRAPSWIRTARLEWLYRLLREPRRLAGRYVLGNPEFLLRIMGQWGSGARTPG